MLLGSTGWVKVRWEVRRVIELAGTALDFIVVLAADLVLPGCGWSLLQVRLVGIAFHHFIEDF